MCAVLNLVLIWVDYFPVKWDHSVKKHGLGNPCQTTDVKRSTRVRITRAVLILNDPLRQLYIITIFFF
jgi:hypothetical protein